MIVEVGIGFGKSGEKDLGSAEARGGLHRATDLCRNRKGQEES